MGRATGLEDRGTVLAEVRNAGRTCVECASPVRRIKEISGPNNGLEFFCSKRCAVDFAAATVSSQYDWCQNHKSWHHPSDGCFDCGKE